MKASIMIAAVVITMRLLADILPDSHHVLGTQQLPAAQPPHGYYGEWDSYVWDETIHYDENGKPVSRRTRVSVASSHWGSSLNIDLTPNANSTKAYGNANITWDEDGYVASKSDYGEDSIDVEIYEVPW